MTIKYVAFGLFLISGLFCPAAAAPVPISAVGSIAEMQAEDGSARPVLQVLAYYKGHS